MAVLLSPKQTTHTQTHAAVRVSHIYTIIQSTKKNMYKHDLQNDVESRDRRRDCSSRRRLFLLLLFPLHQTQSLAHILAPLISLCGAKRINGSESSLKLESICNATSRTLEAARSCPKIYRVVVVLTRCESHTVKAATSSINLEEKKTAGSFQRPWCQMSNANCTTRNDRTDLILDNRNKIDIPCRRSASYLIRAPGCVASGAAGIAILLIVVIVGGARPPLHSLHVECTRLLPLWNRLERLLVLIRT